MTIWRKNNYPNIICPGNISYNCKYILPGRLMQDQPIIGKPLRIKYISENGSSGSKKNETIGYFKMCCKWSN